MICSDLTEKIGHQDSSPSNGHQDDMTYSYLALDSSSVRPRQVE